MTDIIIKAPDTDLKLKQTVTSTVQTLYQSLNGEKYNSVQIHVHVYVDIK